MSKEKELDDDVLYDENDYIEEESTESGDGTESTEYSAEDEEVFGDDSVEENTEEEVKPKKKRKKGRREAEEISDTPITESEKNSKMTKETKKKLSFGVICGIVLVVAIGGMLVAKKASGSMSYSKALNTIVSTRAGSFRYVFDVRTEKAGSADATATTSETTETTETTEATSTEETTEAQEPKHENSEWDNESGTAIDRWVYPNYQVVIEGCVKSTEPLVANYNIYLDTGYESDLFTDVTVFDGKAYINVEQINTWLKNSKDSYLQSLSDYITDGAKYYVVDMANFSIDSRYAEDGEDGKYTEGYKSLNTCMQVLSSMLSACKIKNGDNGSVTIEGLDKQMVYFINNLDTLYDQTGFKPEYKDNVIDAFADERLALTTETNMNMVSNGVYRSYKTSSGNDAVEVSLKAQYLLNGVSKQISMELFKSGDIRDVVMPTGSTTTSAIDLQGCVYDMLDYFNFTEIKLSNKLNTTPESIKADIVDDLIKYIGDDSVNEDNYMDYLSQHMKDENIKAFFNSLNEITGDLVVTVEKEKEEKVEQHPSFSYSGGGITISGKLNEKESSEELIVLDLLVLNEKSEDIEFNTTDYTLKTHKGSVYPANNTTILHDYDNKFDMDKVQETVTIGGNGFARVKMYFVPSEVPEYLDLWNGDTSIGVVSLY